MRINKLKAVWMCTAAVVLMARGIPVVHADEGDYKTLYEEQKKRSDDLEKRISALEASSTQNVAVAKSDIPQKSLDFLGQTEISGFMEASYLYARIRLLVEHSTHMPISSQLTTLSWPWRSRSATTRPIGPSVTAPT